MASDQTFSHFPHIPLPQGVRLATMDPHACSYLPDRLTTLHAGSAQRIDPLLYHELMNAGCRRSGQMVYRPACTACRQCRQIRVPVATFAPSKSQRRALRLNADLLVTIAPQSPTDEKFALYAKYCADWHDRPDAVTRDEFERFLYQSPVDTLDFEYRTPAGKLIGVGVCDVCERSISSVYFYFDPDEAGRSLGTFSALKEIEFAREHGVPHWYAGYWIDRCGKMSYKANFGPAEVLGSDGVWRPLVRGESPAQS